MSDNRRIILEELTAFCKSNSLSEGGLREIIQRHNWTPNNPTIPYFFFLAACGNERVTEDLLRYLLYNFPGAGTFVNQNRSTSLHIACVNKNITLSMVHLLIDAFPTSLGHEDKNGLMPLHQLCGNKHQVKRLDWKY